MPAFSSTDELTVFSNALAGQYEVEREIGRGGMGVVYLARDLRLDRMVAIKTLPLHLASDAAIRERFLREARMAARLAHPNIVPVHRADEVGGQVFFVMGFVDGDSLAAKLAAEKSLSPKRTVPILRDVAAALGYAHSSGLVHRDVKTENILLDVMTGRAMVTDFGIARMGEAAPLTATGQILGTVYYLSPEQVAGDGVDARSDIYALGVVGYAMLSGQFPFDGPLASAVLVAHVNKQPVPLGAIAPHVPASLASIIDRCLAKNPAHRYQTCAELDAALAAAERDADEITSVASTSNSPLVSNTEAQVIFRRAAELQDMTRPYTRPAEPMQRDAAKDAARKEGFKTSNLREAAKEAGIAPEFMQHALVERGLGASPAADQHIVVRDFTARKTRWGGEPVDLSYEVVLEGEVPAHDFDLLVDVLRRTAGEAGTIEIVGRSMTWTGTSGVGQSRPLQVSVFPRNGRTTIRVSASVNAARNGIHGIGFGVGMGLGAVLFGISMSTIHAFYEYVGMRTILVRDKGLHAAAGLGLWALSVVSGQVVARRVANAASRDRQEKLKALIERLAEQALVSIRSKR